MRCSTPSEWECGLLFSQPWGIGWIPTLPYAPTILLYLPSRLISNSATSFVMLSNAWGMRSPHSWGMWDAPILLYGPPHRGYFGSPHSYALQLDCFTWQAGSYLAQVHPLWCFPMHEACEHHSWRECGMPHSFCMGVWVTYLPTVGESLDPHTTIHSNYATMPAKQAHI